MQIMIFNFKISDKRFGMVENLVFLFIIVGLDL